MESEINTAIENLKKAFLSEMNVMSEKHRRTLQELSELENNYEELREAERQIIRKDAVEEFKELNMIISIEDLKLLFKKLCKHKKSYNNQSRFNKFHWPTCNDCPLNSIPSYHAHHFLGYAIRTLCFGIWHDDILNQTNKEEKK